jgi:carbamoyltransferase
MWVLGVNAPPAGWHDAAACLVDAHGRVVAFSEEERLSRRRHSLFRGPKQAVRFCLESAGISPGDVDVVAVGWDGAWMEAGRAHDSREALHAAIGWERSTQAGAEVVNVPHHRAHATCAFHASGYGRAGVLIVDGNGEREATSVWSFEHGREPRLLRWWPTAHSIGYAYDAASRWLGFSLLDAGKTMGLAAYGRAEGLDAPALVDLDDGDYRLLVTDPEGAQPENGRELAHRAGLGAAVRRDRRSRLPGRAGGRAPSQPRCGQGRPLRPGHGRADGRLARRGDPGIGRGAGAVPCGRSRVELLDERTARRPHICPACSA